MPGTPVSGKANVPAMWCWAATGIGTTAQGMVRGLDARVSCDRAPVGGVGVEIDRGIRGDDGVLAVSLDPGGANGLQPRLRGERFESDHFRTGRPTQPPRLFQHGRAVLAVDILSLDN